MPNMCSIKAPAGYNGSGWFNTSGWSDQGVDNPWIWYSQARNATGQAWYFDADLYGIQCTAFPSAGGGTDPLISQASAIQALQSAATGLQSQITAMAPWVGASAAQGQADRIADMSDVWTLFLGAAIVIMCWKGVQRLFDRSPSVD